MGIIRLPLCDELIITPGNPGTDAFGRRADIGAEDIDALVHLAKTEQADIVVVGPEVPLVDGLVDRLEAKNICAFGPTAAAAQLEGSKRFARDFCSQHHIPQPQWAYFTDPDEAKAFAASLSGGCVVKADGLAAGKGVTVCDTTEQANASIDEMLVGGSALPVPRFWSRNGSAGQNFLPLRCWMAKRRYGWPLPRITNAPMTMMKAQIQAGWARLAHPDLKVMPCESRLCATSSSL